MSVPTQVALQTARELGLMAGFPTPHDQRVTHDNQLLGPYNRWSFQHALQMNRTADVWRGNDAPSVLESAPRALADVTYRTLTGAIATFGQMVETSATDGIVVLHDGKILYERYLNDMQLHTLHVWASASKSMTGTLAALLAHEGLIDLDAAVSVYLPELRDSGYGTVTVRQVADMTTAVRFRSDSHHPSGTTENLEYGVALGWHAAPPDYDGPRTVYELLPTMQQRGAHGETFTYLTTNTDVLAWIIRRVTGQTLAALMQERLWSKLGADRDAFWIVDSANAETAGSGLVTTLRDMARFGQLMLQQGFFNGQQILPAAVVEDIQRGADREAFARSSAASPANRGYSYHHQWWLTHNKYGAYQALGAGGQLLYIAPGARLVIAKMSSYPLPTFAGKEFYSAFAAFPALAAFLS